eukprot:4927157-Prymnesium_polylepis.1
MVNTSRSDSAAGIPRCSLSIGLAGRRNGLVSNSTAIVVGTRRVVGLDGESKPEIGLSVLVCAVDGRLGWERGKSPQRVPSLCGGAFEQPAAAEREQRVADESDAGVRHVVGNVSERVAAHVDDLDCGRAQLERVAAAEWGVDTRDLMGLSCWSEHLTAGALHELVIPAGVAAACNSEARNMRRRGQPG